MNAMKLFPLVGALIFLPACGRGCGQGAREAAPAPAAAKVASGAPTPPAEAPQAVRLVALPFSAYTTTLAIDGEWVDVFTRNALHRVAPGQPPKKVDLDLGNGPVLAESGIIYWSKGAIWRAARDGASVAWLAALPIPPEYFVASSGGIAWLDRAEDGRFRIQTLVGHTPKVLLGEPDELSSVHMVHDGVFFVRRAKDNSWRIGRVSIAGGSPEYSSARSGPTPSMLTGREGVIYYDLDKSEIRELTTDLKSESVWQRDFVCSPIFEAGNLFCARVEGLFEIMATSHLPKPLPLPYTRRQTITYLKADAKRVVWIVDAGPDQLAVDMLPLE
jgi:hypothetical protein